MGDMIFWGEQDAFYKPVETGLYNPYEVAVKFNADDCDGKKYGWRNPIATNVVALCGNDIELLKYQIKRWYATEQGKQITTVPGDIYDVATGEVVYHGELGAEFSGQPVTQEYKLAQQQREEQSQTVTVSPAQAMIPWLTGQMIPNVPNWVLLGMAVIGVSVVGVGVAVSGGKKPVEETQ